MRQRQNHSSRVAAGPGGYTLLEFIVAMVVFGVALTGLMPLVAILSRDLQPQLGQKGTTPARDWNTDDCPRINHRRTTWYMTAYDDPWVRKLGASARVTSGSVSYSTPVPLELPVRQQDDDNAALDADNDTMEDYSDPAWDYNNSAASAVDGDQHRKAALPAGSLSTGDAVWRFKVPTAGYYSIQATWTAAADQANDAQFSVYKNSIQQTARTVNQTADPIGVTSSGRAWTSLTTGLSLGLMQLAKDDTIEVHLSDVRATSPDSGTYVVADAVRIVQNTVTLKSVERSLTGQNRNSNSADATANVSVSVNIPQ